MPGVPKQLSVQVRIEDGSLWATVDEFPGVFATGDTLDELRQSLEEAISLFVALPGEDGPSIRLRDLQPEPAPTTAQVVCV